MTSESWFNTIVQIAPLFTPPQHGCTGHMVSVIVLVDGSVRWRRERKFPAAASVDEVRGYIAAQQAEALAYVMCEAGS